MLHVGTFRFDGTPPHGRTGHLVDAGRGALRLGRARTDAGEITSAGDALSALGVVQGGRLGAPKTGEK